MKKTIKIILGLIVLVALIALVFGFMFLGSIVKAGVEEVGPMVTKVPVTLDGAAVSLFSGSGELKGFKVGNPEGFKAAQAIQVRSVNVSIAPGSVLKDKVVVHSVRVQAPEITYEQGLKGNNLSKILENVQAIAGTGTNQPAAASGPGKKLQVDEFVISGGKITVATSMLGGKGATLPLPEIRLANLGQGPEGITPAELIERTLNAVVNGTLKAVAEGAGELAKQGLDIGKKAGAEGMDTAKKAGTEATKAVQKVGTGLGDLLKKK
jgi:uncharacterized protein involved in outer membrane biogenesis